MAAGQNFKQDKVFTGLKIDVTAVVSIWQGPMIVGYIYNIPWYGFGSAIAQGP